MCGVTIAIEFGFRTASLVAAACYAFALGHALQSAADGHLAGMDELASLSAAYLAAQRFDVLGGATLALGLGLGAALAQQV